MLILLFVLLRNVHSDTDSDRTCHKSVLFHRVDSILPSTGLFCVIRTNEDSHIGNVPIIQTEEQWSDYVVENPGLDSGKTSHTSSPPLLLVKKDDTVLEFLLPSSFMGSKCSGTQQVALGFSQSVSCSPPFYPFNETECLSNDFLSAQTLFESPIISYNGNVSMETNFQSNSSFLPVQWQNNQCKNVIQEVSLTIAMNNTLVMDANVSSIQYVTVTASNYSTFKQTFNVNFKNVLEQTVQEKKDGFVQGQIIYSIKDDGSSTPFSLPKSGPCRKESHVPVKFLVNTTTACTVRASRCNEIQEMVRDILEEFVPVWISNSPLTDSANDTNALVIRKNWTDETKPDIGCLITTEFTINVHFAKQGTNGNRVIVSTTYNMYSEKITLASETTVVLRFALHFIDATPPPSLLFAALPQIDLRLPNDFFYPFLTKSPVINALIFMEFDPTVICCESRKYRNRCERVDGKEVKCEWAD
ncbi:hypothetical protein RB195_000624 [Necator americanus]|uniref:Tectonic-1-3 domain-containing protein n=1 Tax=Necator americanus TaxID=51031 RepID=A0ABR1DBA5_NECAM